MAEPVIAVILARKNSKGIPLKNLRQLAGRSLLTITIESAIASNIFDQIIVSSDGEQIIQAARQYPQVTGLRRPDILATDTAKSIDAMLHVFDQLGIYSGTAALLQPTSPLRSGQHIRQAHALFCQQLQQQGTGSVISACIAEHHPYKMLVKQTDKYLPVNKLTALEQPRQRLPRAVRPNGAIYINKIEDLRQHQTFFIDPVSIFEMSAAESIDIDTLADLQKAETILLNIAES